VSNHWLFAWKTDAGKPASKAASVIKKSGGIQTERGGDNFAKSLLLSLALHALVISLQFGESDSGLPWFAMPGEERFASIPTLNAILRSQVATEKPAADRLEEPVVGESKTYPAKPLVREPPPPHLPLEPATASMAKLVTLPQETGEQGRVAGTEAEVPKLDAPDAGIAVLGTDKESAWSLPAAKARLEEEARNEQPAVEKTGEAPLLEEKMVEDLARIEEEKAALAAAVREKELALERKRAEDLARLEAKKAEQAAAAKAKEDALTKQAEAEAMARKRQAEQAAAEKASAERAAAEKIAAEKNLAAAQNRMPNVAAGKSAAGKENGAGPAAEKGSELARRALDMARSGLPGLSGPPAREPAASARPRRGGILGRDPKDIQLVFYGEGWRQKVERIGSMNYPRLSKNLVYDPLVATVSINSDGTLAGVRIEKSSGHKDLDAAVLRIVTMSAPFAAFPPDLKRSYDVVDITRTWTFQEDIPRITGQ